MSESRILGTIDVEREQIYCLNCDRKAWPKRIYPGGRMHLVVVGTLNTYEPWCMECCVPLMEKILNDAGIPMPTEKAPQIDVEQVAASLRHIGLEPWPDGRSILDGKRPEEQHVGMVIGSLKAQLDAALLQIRAFTDAKAKDLEALMDLLEVLSPAYLHARALRRAGRLENTLEAISKQEGSALVAGWFSSVIETFEKWGEVAGVFAPNRKDE